MTTITSNDTYNTNACRPTCVCDDCGRKNFERGAIGVVWQEPYGSLSPPHLCRACYQRLLEDAPDDDYNK